MPRRTTQRSSRDNLQKTTGSERSWRRKRSAVKWLQRLIIERAEWGRQARPPNQRSGISNHRMSQTFLT